MVSWLEAFVNPPHCPHGLAGLHRAYADFVIVVDNCHLITSLRLGNGALRYQQSAILDAGFDAHTSVLAGTKNVAAVGKGSNDANCASAWIHFPGRPQAFAFLRVDGAVSQDQFQ